jgi:hypothetical protein
MPHDDEHTTTYVYIDGAWLTADQWLAQIYAALPPEPEEEQQW